MYFNKVQILSVFVIVLAQLTLAADVNKSSGCRRSKLLVKRQVPVYQPYDVYQKRPVYRYEKYPVEVPVRVPVYVNLKRPYSAAGNKYDHEYHADTSRRSYLGNDRTYGRHLTDYGRHDRRTRYGQGYFGRTGIGRFFGNLFGGLGGYRYGRGSRPNNYDDSQAKKA